MIKQYPNLLEEIRIAMRLDKVSMAILLGIAYRTMQDYEADQRRTPERVATKARELYVKDREWVAGIPARMDEREARGEVPGPAMWEKLWDQEQLPWTRLADGRLVIDAEDLQAMRCAV